MTTAMGIGMEGRRVRLERVRAKHTEALYGMAQAPGWPLAGAGLGFDEFVDLLWSTSPVQFCIVRKDDDEVVGFVRGQRWNQRDSTIDVVFGVAPEYWQLLWPYEGIVLFCDYLLRGLGVRKLYFELRTSTLAKLGSGVRRWLTRELVHPDLLRSPEGAPEDMEIWSLSASHPVVDRMLGREG